MIAAGKLRHLVTLQRKTVSGKDAMGGEVYTWTDVAIERADVRPANARELVANDQRQAETLVQIDLRYRADVVPEWRVLWQGRPYDIRSVLDMDGRGRHLRLLAAYGLRDG